MNDEHDARGALGAVFSGSDAAWLRGARQAVCTRSLQEDPAHAL